MQIKNREAAPTGGLFLSDGDFVPTGTFRDPGEKTRREYRLVTPVIYEVGGRGSGLIVTVPAGYITDLYSLPGRLLQFWQPSGARWWGPPLLHDWLYDTGLAPRKIADAVLQEAMMALDVDPALRLIVYVGVRVGGRMGRGHPEPANYGLVKAARETDLSVRLAAYLNNGGKP